MFSWPTTKDNPLHFGYLVSRGYWDDWLQRSHNKTEEPSTGHAVPRRGYLEVIVDGYAPMFDPLWDDWDEDVARLGTLPDVGELGNWSIKQHGLRMGREAFLACHQFPTLNEALVDALTHFDLGSTYSPERIREEVVGDDPELLNTFELYRGPEQAELDLHLEGPGVEGHTTDAKHFAKFITKISGAVAAAANVPIRAVVLPKMVLTVSIFTSAVFGAFCAVRRSNKWPSFAALNATLDR